MRADLGLSAHVLKIQLYRARQREGAPFQNIRNPYYNARNSQRLVLLESLPAELRKQVESHLRAAGVYHEAALMELEKEGAPSEEITSTATQMTTEVVLSSQPVLERARAQQLQNGFALLGALSSSRPAAYGGSTLRSDLRLGAIHLRSGALYLRALRQRGRAAPSQPTCESAAEPERPRGQGAERMYLDHPPR